MNTGLFILRQIDPPQRLADQLDALGHLYQFEDGTQWVDDDRPRDTALNDSIVGWWSGQPPNQVKGGDGCTVGFGIFSWDGDVPVKVAGPYSRRDRAERALAGAKPRVMTEFDIEEEDKPPKKKPFEA